MAVWTEERVEKLKALWAEGVTAAEIAKLIGDVSRNAVIGKAHRLGLSNRAASIKGAELSSEEPCELTRSATNKENEKTTKAAEESAAAADPATDAAKNGGAKAKASSRGRSKPEPHAEEAAPKPAAERTETSAAVLEQEAFEAALESDEGDEQAVNPVAALAAEAERMARKLTLLELNERTCKWPIGDPSTDDFYFCGLPCAPEKPYCQAHVQVAYQPMSSRRDRERSRARAQSA